MSSFRRTARTGGDALPTSPDRAPSRPLWSGRVAGARATAATLCAALAAAGCASRHDQGAAFVRSHETPVASGQYIVGPADIIIVHTSGADELDGLRTTVRPDGKIDLRLLGEVDVAGLTTTEISAKLKGLLVRYYVAPEVVVQLFESRSRHYFVFGEVTYGGARVITGQETLLRALAEAQPTFLAWRQRIRVVRPAAEPGERKVMIVDMDKLAKSGDQSLDVRLQAGDVIEVPPSPLAWVGERVREVLYPVGPVLQAYSVPASPIAATQVYQDAGNNDDHDDHEDHSRRSLLLGR